MKIDNNPIEIEAMKAFHRGDYDEGHRLQEKFLAEFHESLKWGEDFCSCTANCNFLFRSYTDWRRDSHGKCECSSQSCGQRR